MAIDVKICGIRDEAALNAAVKGGAKFVGFVFFPKSKNAITPHDARKLASLVPSSVIRTGMFVDAHDDEIRAALDELSLDLLQLHGTESPMRVVEIKKLTGLPVMKALHMREPAHLEAVPAFEEVADRLLFDSRIGDEPSGGPIDWKLLKGKAFKKPWLLAGGLNVQNLEQAARAAGARGVDVSSSLDAAPGQKDPKKIRDFLELAARL